MIHCAQEEAAARLRKEGKHGRARYTYQPPLQFEATRMWCVRRRRSTPPCASPVIVCSGIFQPLAVDSMARWTSTRPMAFGEEAVPWNARGASATGAAATVASRVGRMSFGDARRPFEGGSESGDLGRGLIGFGRIGPMR